MLTFVNTNTGGKYGLGIVGGEDPSLGKFFLSTGSGLEYNAAILYLPDSGVIIAGLQNSSNENKINEVYLPILNTLQREWQWSAPNSGAEPSGMDGDRRTRLIKPKQEWQWQW